MTAVYNVKMCCPKCFGDKGLSKEIFPLRSNDFGTCGYCNSEQVSLVDPLKLSEYFELLISIYKYNDNGRSLIEWLKEDWLLFDHQAMDDANAKILLADVLNNGDIIRKKFSIPPEGSTDNLVNWNKLRNELRHENRFFPNADIDLDRLKELLSRLIFDTDDLPEKWFRARMQDDNIQYDIENMGAPPKHVASHGRANPAGIPYLYLGSMSNTAVSEIRPHTGEKASVAEFKINQNLRIVDLREPRKLISPFLLTDENEIASLREDIGFLERLGEELTTPVLPTAAAIDYIPSQYLCEFIKKCGYDGVTYKSSVSDGVNMALFYPDKAKAISVQGYDVSSVKVSMELIT